MYNWSTDLARLKENPEVYGRFVLEQRVNYGLNDQKLSASLLKKHWNTLRLDPSKKKFLERLLWPAS